jgi:hypothetical protein
MYICMHPSISLYPCRSESYLPLPVHERVIVHIHSYDTWTSKYCELFRMWHAGYGYENLCTHTHTHIHTHYQKRKFGESSSESGSEGYSSGADSGGEGAGAPRNRWRMCAYWRVKLCALCIRILELDTQVMKIVVRRLLVFLEKGYQCMLVCVLSPYSRKEGFVLLEIGLFTHKWRCACV